MDQARLQDIRQLVEGTTIMPSMALDWTEIIVRTDDAHRKQDFRLHHECRGIIIDLLDEIDEARKLAQAILLELEQLEPPSAHAVYCATVRQVTALQDELARAQWVAAEFMDG